MKRRTLQPTIINQVAGVSHELGSMQMNLSQIGDLSNKEKEVYYKIKSYWVLEQKFNCRLVFWDSLG